MQLTEALRYALDGSAVLFVGAGFSADAETRNHTKLPTGGRLAELLANELGLGAVPPLDRVSDMYKQRKGAHRLLSLLNERLRAERITPPARNPLHAAVEENLYDKL